MFISSQATLSLKTRGVSASADVLLASDFDLLAQRNAGEVATVSANGAVSLLSWQGLEALSAAAGGLNLGRVTLDAPSVVNPDGTIELVAGAGSLLMGSDTQLSTLGASGGQVRVVAGGAVTVSQIVAGAGQVAIVARGASIIDGDSTDGRMAATTE